jgi:hypothetical protein
MQDGRMMKGQGKESDTPERRVLDVEDVVRWAYQEELPKRERQLGLAEPCEVSPMFRGCDLGVRVDNWNREPGFPAAMGPAHPDALKVEAAVKALARFRDLPIEGALDLGPDFNADPEAEARAMRRAFLAIDTVVILMAKMPISRSRPFWQSRPTLSSVTQPNGKTLVLRWETQFMPRWPEGEVAEDVLVPVAPSRKDAYPPGSYCPLRYDTDPDVVLGERAEYLAWWGGLNALAEDLADRLESIVVLPPAAAQKPWLEHRTAVKSHRVLQDLRTTIYRKEDRQTAAAHRALGHRRLMPGRRGMTATPIARRPASMPAARGLLLVGRKDHGSSGFSSAAVSAKRKSK